MWHPSSAQWWMLLVVALLHFEARIAHFVLPIRGKGSSDWAYAWVPIIGPIIGGIIGGWASTLLLPVLR